MLVHPDARGLAVSRGVMRNAGGTDSIHLAAEGVDDYAHGLVARGFVEGVADVEFDRHGDLAFVAGEGVVVEGDVGGFHGGGRGGGRRGFVVVVVVVVVGGGSVVWFAKWFGVGLGVGELFKHDWAVVGMFVGDEGLGGFCTRMKNGLRHPYLDKGLRDAIAGSRSCV